ncbi:ABC transporter substrate-binding protein [Acrocarpospora pleiomorpha]|uniref:ABC transporter substrate-binding protein n=1 Tax=Acrocarpospora pleiomorpha TaxID=90975 RepID=A0A5M3XXG1_9ACTN|nr:ABC transporter substrate-binding protein [Acrocarpospora pleiomorpha]GES24241.1 ABC transporter substrate-binding protein [Acrocarpospora pleiomorpha]
MNLHRRTARRVIAIATALTATLPMAACAGGAGDSPATQRVLRIGSSMPSFPNLDTGGITNGGYEGQRLIGNNIYDGLTRWDVSDTSKPRVIAPGLATSWTVSDDSTVYDFQLRPGVTFQDGTPWNADAAAYNFDRYLNPQAPQYSAAVIGNYPVLTRIKSVEKTGDQSIRITMKEPYAYLLDDIYNVYMASPDSLRKSGSDGQSAHPVGTGPFSFGSINSQELTLKKNPNWWGGAPKLDEIDILLIPDNSARVAALRSQRVDWIEGADPDDLAGLKAAGFVTTEREFDWIWGWVFDLSKKPFDDPRVRQALNYAIDRKAIASDLLLGTAVPETQTVPAANPAYDANDDHYSYDPAKAKQLLADAGYPDGFSFSLGYITSGSGTMKPKTMNEQLQSQLAKVGVKVNLVPTDFSVMITSIWVNKKIPADWGGYNAPFSMGNFSEWGSFMFGCDGQSVSHYCNPDAQKLMDEAQVTADEKARLALLTQAARIVTAEAPWLYVVNDKAPRAMTKAVTGFNQPMSWWIDFTPISTSMS